MPWFPKSKLTNSQQQRTKARWGREMVMEMAQTPPGSLKFSRLMMMTLTGETTLCISGRKIKRNSWISSTIGKLSILIVNLRSLLEGAMPSAPFRIWIVIKANLPTTMKLQNKMAPPTPRIPKKRRVVTLQKARKMKGLRRWRLNSKMMRIGLQTSRTKRPAKPSGNGRRKKGCTTTTLRLWTPD